MDLHEVHHGGEGGVVTWEAFRGKFLSEYFPNSSVRYAKEVEFL